jgi:shikimate kinase
MSIVMELMGPAGAGKTTLLRALADARPGLRAAPHVSRVWHLPLVLQNTLPLLPSFLRRRERGRWFTWPEARSMVYLDAWLRLLARDAGSDRIVVLDHGPIFNLAMLREFGPELTADAAFRRWSDRLLSRWAETLDVIVWLDAPDQVLVERIRGRDQKHLVKTASTEEASAFLQRCRRSFEEFLAPLDARPSPEILRFDTERQPTHELAAKILDACDSRGSARSG